MSEFFLKKIGLASGYPTLKKKSLTAVATALTAMSRLSKSMFASSSNFWKSKSTCARFPGTLRKLNKMTSNQIKLD